MAQHHLKNLYLNRQQDFWTYFAPLWLKSETHVVEQGELSVDGRLEVELSCRTRLAFHINTRYHFTRYYTSINDLSRQRKFTIIKTVQKNNNLVAPFST